MKNKIIYFAIIFVLVFLGIFGLQKDNIAKADTCSINFNPFTLGSGYRISFDASLDKSKYIVGENGHFNIDIYGEGPGGSSLCGSNFNHTYTGTLYIEGKSIGLFSGTPASLCDLKYVQKIILFSAPGNYNAKISVTRYYKILFFNASDTHECSIPYTVAARDSFRIDPQGTINMKVGDKIQLKAWYDDNIDDSTPEVDVTNL